MKKYFLGFLCLSYARAFLEYQNNEKDEALTKCVVKFIEEWQINNNNRSYLRLAVIDIGNYLELGALHKLNGIDFISKKTLRNVIIHTIPRVAYVIENQDSEELEITLTEISKDLYWNPQAKFIIIVQDVNDDIDYISKLLREHNMFDVILITYVNNDYAVYKNNFTSSVSSNASEHFVFVSLCSKYLVKNSSPALVKKDDLRGYRFQVIAHDVWPFANFNDPNMQGTEEHLLSLFEFHTGVKIDIVSPPELDDEGNIIHGHIKDMLERVHNREFEATIGGHDYRFAHQYYNYSGNLSYTYPLAIDHLIYVLPRANLLPPWEAVFRRCIDTYVVAGILYIVFCVSAIFLEIFSLQKEHAIRDMFIVLGYILNKTNTRSINSRLPQRLVVISISLFALIIPYVLQAHLYSVITSPVTGYEPKVVSELSTHKVILMSESADNNKIKYYEDCGSRLNCLLEVKNCPAKSLYTVVAETYYYIFAPQLVDKYCNLGVYRLNNPYAMLMRVIPLRRGSILLKPLNKFLFKAMSAGLLNKYGRDLYRKYGLKCRSSRKIKTISLNLHDVNGAFVVFVGGNCLSFLVFICEILISKYCGGRRTQDDFKLPLSFRGVSPLKKFSQ